MSHFATFPALYGEQRQSAVTSERTCYGFLGISFCGEGCDYLRQGSGSVSRFEHGGGWIRDPLYVPQKFAARIKSLNMASENRAAVANIEAGWDQNVDQWIREALASQTGNCCELSAIAFRYLQRQGIRPVEFFGVYRGSWNHAFVVLNHDQSVQVRDFANWSRLAVVCDPSYDGLRTRDFCRRGIRTCFRCETVTSSWFQRSGVQTVARFSFRRVRLLRRADGLFPSPHWCESSPSRVTARACWLLIN